MQLFPYECLVYQLFYSSKLQADGRFGEALPLIIFGGSTIIVAALSTKLPETKGRKLLENVKDAEHEDDVSIDEYGNQYISYEFWTPKIYEKFSPEKQ